MTSNVYQLSPLDGGGWSAENSELDLYHVAHTEAAVRELALQVNPSARFVKENGTASGLSSEGYEVTEDQ